MKKAMSSWKTTTAAVLAACSSVFTNLSAVLDADVATAADWNATAPLVFLAIGLVFSRDHSVSSESAGAE